MFFEPSTRTANSFAVAAQQLGAHWLAFDTGGSSHVQGRVDRGHDAHHRRHRRGCDRRAASRKRFSARARAPLQRIGHQRGRRLARASDPRRARCDDARRGVRQPRRASARHRGDIRHSRVARSSARAMWLLGARVTLVRAAVVAHARPRPAGDSPTWRPISTNACRPPTRSCCCAFRRNASTASELPPFEDLAGGYGLTPARMAKLPAARGRSCIPGR